MIQGTVPNEIRQGPDAIRETVAAARPQARRIAAGWRAQGISRVHVIGNGTSLHSSLASAQLYRHLAGPDDPIVVPLTAAEFVHYQPALGPGDAIIGISSSGEFRDVIRVAERVRGVTPMAGIVHVPGSSLTHLVSDLVFSQGGPSTVPVMTKTFSATLVATELLLLELLGGNRADDGVEGILAAADASQRAIEDAEGLVEPLAHELLATEHFFVTGGGLGYPAALEAALKLKEMALVHAEGAEVWEMESGAATMLGPGAVVIALATEGPARPALAQLLGNAVAWGARTIEVGHERLVDGSTLFPLPAGTREEHTTLSAVPPIALFAFALARARGANPDHPGWIERYHAQGLRHILVGETPA